MVCEKCGYEGFEDDNYCRQCGEEYSSFNCECGAEVDEGDNYCHACGAALEGVVEESDEDIDDNLEQTEISQPQTEQPQQNW